MLPTFVSVAAYAAVASLSRDDPTARSIRCAAPSDARVLADDLANLYSFAVAGCCWRLLAAGCWLFLAAEGWLVRAAISSQPASWLLLDAAGCCWMLLDAVGSGNQSPGPSDQ